MRILALAADAELREHILSLCPQRGEDGAWESRTEAIPALLAFLETLSPDESRAASRIIDAYLTETLNAGLLILPSAVDDVTLQRLCSHLDIRNTVYESMPAEVLFEILGGASLAVIHIEEGSPETTEKEHVHNGSRLVICLSDTGVLELPGRSIALRRGDAVWMDPKTLHSFQKGTYLALHTSEAGFDHHEAFLPKNWRPRASSMDATPD